MALKIKKDHARFREILRGRIKQNLKKYISNGELVSKQGRDTITVPLPQIDLPHFGFDHRDGGGVGQGDGEVGQSLQPGQVEPGAGKAGQGSGEHGLDVEVSLDELAQMLGEVLELPHIKPRGSEQMETQKTRYTGIQTQGPDALRHFKRTYKEALRRHLIAGDYRPERPVIVPTRADQRYRSWRVQERPDTRAVILYMMDVSGSMGDEQKDIVRIESFWLDTWLRSQYRGLTTRYIIHDAVAKEVDQQTFFHTRESGGTMISSAYRLCAEIIAADYPVSDWNIYPFHFSDGDNWSADDTKVCLDVMRDKLLPVANAFCYGQVTSPYGSGQFIKDVKDAFGNDPKVITSEIPHKDAIHRSIQDFLGRGA